MKSVKDYAGNCSKGFPKLQVSSTGNIYLMTAPTVGTRVFSVGGGFAIGQYESSWNPDDLKDFNGTITLSNG